MGNVSFDFWSTITIAIFAFLATVIGVYYTRNAYLLTLKSYEKNKARSDKAKHYYETYINKPPSFRPSEFLKKIDSDELNEGVNLPSEFTDFLIKNHPSKYFYFASRLSKAHQYFIFSESKQNPEILCKIKRIFIRQLFFFALYIVFATLASFLSLFNSRIISSFSDDNFWGILFLLIIVIISFLALMIICLNKTTQLSEVRALKNELKKTP